MKEHTTGFTSSTKVTDMNMSRRPTLLQWEVRRRGTSPNRFEYEFHRADKADDFEQKDFDRFGFGKNNRLDHSKKADQDGGNIETQGLHFGLNSQTRYVSLSSRSTRLMLRKGQAE
jgi:hypothetical protein